jgi:hypothetical protein
MSLTGLRCNHDIQYLFAQPDKVHAVFLYIAGYIVKGGLSNLSLVALATTKLVSLSLMIVV